MRALLAVLCAVLLSLLVVVPVYSSDQQAVYATGDAVDTSDATVIAKDWRDADSADEIRSMPAAELLFDDESEAAESEGTRTETPARHAVRRVKRPPRSRTRRALSEDDLNHVALDRATQDIPSLLHDVDLSLNKFVRHAYSDWSDDDDQQLPANSPLVLTDDNREDSQDDAAFIELTEQQQFVRLRPSERLAALHRKKDALAKLRDTVALELQASTTVAERVKAHVHAAPEPIEHSSDDPTLQLYAAVPEIKDWAAQVRFRQRKREVHSLLDQSAAFMGQLQQRLQNNYAL